MVQLLPRLLSYEELGLDYRTAKGWLAADERDLLARLAEEATARHETGAPQVMNVGVEYGASCVCLYAGMRSPNGLLAVDIDWSKYVGPPLRYPYTMDSGELAELCLRLARESNGRDGWFDVVFIDGDHSYTGVARDTKFAESINVGGVIAFHDCYSLDYGKPHVHPHSPDCNIAVEAWYQEHRGEWEEQESVDSIRWFRRVS